RITKSTLHTTIGSASLTNAEDANSTRVEKLVLRRRRCHRLWKSNRSTRTSHRIEGHIEEKKTSKSRAGGGERVMSNTRPIETTTVIERTRIHIVDTLRVS